MRWILSAVLTFCLLNTETFSFAQTNDAAGSLAGSYNNLGFKLLRQTRRAFPEKNIFLSPAGLGFALSMAAAGAEGNTLSQIKSVLQIDSATDLNQANQKLVQQLSKLDPKIKLEIANSLWTAEDCKLKPDYLHVARQFYNADAACVDFRNPATANIINAWVSDHTHGKISKMVEPPLGANRLILLDAIYFKGDWTTQFDKKLTRDLPFVLANGESISHPRMSRTGEFQYYAEDGFEAVSLPYANRAVSMCVILPKGKLDDFLPQLNAENWKLWTARLHSRKGTVELPRFKLENEYGLKDVLKSMGMTDAFDRNRANFYDISSERLYINWIKQKTYVDVNEEGTEAAAVTGIGFRALVARQPEPPFHMIVDHPFFLAIRDNQSGAILFLGAVADPR